MSKFGETASNLGLSVTNGFMAGIAGRFFDTVQSRLANNGRGFYIFCGLDTCWLIGWIFVKKVKLSYHLISCA